MNLSLILNLPAGNAPANPTNAPAVRGQGTAEMASFQDFLSLMGLSPMAAEAGLELAGDDGVTTDPTTQAAKPEPETGNLLPPALPVLPDAATAALDPALLVQSAVVGPNQTSEIGTSEQPKSALSRSAPAVPQALQPQAAPAQATVAAGLPVPPEALAAALAEAAAAARLLQAQPTRVQSPTAQPTVAFDLPLPAADQPQLQPLAQQAAAQPVLAQLLQAQPRAAQRKGGEEATIAAPVGAKAVDLSNEAARPATPAPVLPVAATVAIAAPMPDTARPTAAPSIAAAAATTERHDFAAVIDKLAEARELARPGRADMHLPHREFGQVSVHFELAGQALKVAMSSADPGFAPAVQAALAERPVAAVADAARGESQPQRSDTVNASTASWQAGPQADGQRQDGQHRTQQARPGHTPVRHNDSDSDGAGGTAPGRDGSRFA